MNTFNEDFEPVASGEEVNLYENEFREEQEEEQMLLDRFDEKIVLRDWCSCSRCDMANIVTKEECFCCQDINRCLDKIAELDEEVPCITMHPGFKNVCLDTWVLDAAAIGLKTRKGRSYTVLREQGRRTTAEFYRSVAYRQFFRLVWQFEGVTKRLPLPCCVYNIIRSTFSSEDGMYRGFLEEEDEDEGGDKEDNEEEEDTELSGEEWGH